MNPAFALIVFAPGLAIGSFLNVLAARVPLHRSLVRPGSACMSCSQPIAWYDNIPLVSYIALRGRCRHCDKRIGLIYPAVELVSALLVSACVLVYGLTPEAAIAAFFCCVLVAISAVDLKHRIVPDRIVLPATVLVLVAQTLREPSLEWLLCALGASLFLFLAVLAYPAGMGMGDVKLALLMGAALGKLRRRRAHAGDDRGPRAGALPARAPRPGRPEDGDSVRAVPCPGLDCRPLLRANGSSTRT